MRRLISLFLVLLISVWLGLKIMNNPGYVAMSYQHWLVEMPLWFFIIIEAILFSVCYLLLKIVSSLLHSVSNFKHWLSTVKTHHSQSLTTQGMIEFAAENWGKSEKHLIKAVKHNEHPLVNYLAAAHAAQQQTAIARRDQHLQNALLTTPTAKLAIDMTRAHLQIASNQSEQALTTLKEILAQQPNYLPAWKLLHHLYVNLEEWKEMRAILPKLQSLRALPEDQLFKTQLRTYQALLVKAAQQGIESLHDMWWQSPYSLKKSPQFNACYAQLLISLNDDDVAELQLRKILKKHWDNELITLYGLCSAKNPQAQLRFAEKWLTKYPQHAPLLLALGRICKRNQLWGKARTYLINSLELSPQAITYAELANLLKQLGEEKLSTEYYREGLLFVTNATQETMRLCHSSLDSSVSCDVIRDKTS